MKTSEVEAATAVEPKKARNRSPNHPLLSLPKALERAKELYDEYGKHEVPIARAHLKWGYKEQSGLANQCVAALRAYGLLSVKGKGKGAPRKVELTDRADRIIRGAPNRLRLLQAAAREPVIHAELLQEYAEKGLPPNDILRTYLVWEREGGRFNEDVVDGFIERFRDSLRFAELEENGIIQGEKKDADDSGLDTLEDKTQTVTVGSYVQWTSRGVDQFQTPLRVVGISDDSQWVFVEGSPTGIAMNELTIQEPPKPPTSGDPPPSPYYKQPPPAGEGTHIRFPLSGGNSVEIRLNRRVSPSDFDRIKALVELSRDSLVEEEALD